LGGRGSSLELQGDLWSLHDNETDTNTDDDVDNDDGNNDDGNVEFGNVANTIREALRDEYPELDTDLYSDAYLESVAAVPYRALDYAIHQKIKGALEWRRKYGVESLRSAFDTVESSDTMSGSGNNNSSWDKKNKTNYSPKETSINHSSININSKTAQGSAFRGKFYVPRDRGTDHEHEESNTIDGFVPSPKLVEVCTSGAFVVLEEEIILGDEESSSNLGKKNETESENGSPTRRLAVYADTSRLNWWKTGVTVGLHYHVLVLEDALDRIRRENNNNNNVTAHNNINTKLEESLVICVDTTAPPLRPPPLGVLKGFVRLLQGAYPDRIHRIYVGPVSPLLRRLYDCVRPFLKPRSRNKIVLLGEAPSELLERWKRSLSATTTSKNKQN
jgi:hypothetical protein